MILEPERAAVLLAERLARPRSGPAESGRAGTEWLVQRTLEELGIHCEANGALQDLKGFLIASPGGPRSSSRTASPRTSASPSTPTSWPTPSWRRPRRSRTGCSPCSPSRRTPSWTAPRATPGRSSATWSTSTAGSPCAPTPSSGQRGRHRPGPGHPAREPGRRPQLRLPALPRPRPGPRAAPRPGADVARAEPPHQPGLFWLSPKYRRLRSRPEVAHLVRTLESLTRAAYAC